jgi:anti-sigma factor RsiW
MTTTQLSDDDVRALFSDHLEGALDDETRHAVDDALARDPQLAAEQRAFAQTVAALRSLPRAEAPKDLVAQVRARLAAVDDAGVASLPRAANDDVADTGVHMRARASWRYGLGALAAVAAVAAIALWQPHADGGGDSGGVLGAALHDEVVAVQWAIDGVSQEMILHAAREAGLRIDGDAFVGDQASAARFFVELKSLAAAAGHRLTGTVPERSDEVRVTVVRTVD